MNPRSAKAAQKSREVEILVEQHIRDLWRAAGKIPPTVVRELLFHPVRKWRFDFSVPVVQLAVEIEGGIHTRGRHTRGVGYQGDLDKYNAALALGWRVFRFSTTDVRNGKDVTFLKAWYLRTEPFLETDEMESH